MSLSPANIDRRLRKLLCIELFIITLLSSRYDINNVEKGLRQETITITHSANSADDKLMVDFYFIFSPENKLCHFMQIISKRDNLREMSRKNKKNILKCHVLKFLSAMLSVKIAANL